MKVLKNTYTLYQNEIWDLTCVNNNEVFNTTCNENGTWENIECDNGKRRVKIICSCYYMLLYVCVDLITSSNIVNKTREVYKMTSNMNVLWILVASGLVLLIVLILLSMLLSSACCKFSKSMSLKY